MNIEKKIINKPTYEIVITDITVEELAAIKDMAYYDDSIPEIVEPEHRENIKKFLKILMAACRREI